MWKSGLVLVAVVGCGSSSPAIEPTAVDVTISGNRYHAAQAISSPLPSIPSGKIETGMVVLSSSTDVCLPADSQIQHPGETTIVILLKDGDGPPTGPATFTAVDANSTGTPPPRIAILYTSILDANCGNNAEQQTSAVAGTVTLTAVHDGAYAGKFDVALDSGDHITGTFDADNCVLLPGELASDSTPLCTP
jgi:hypothetical protein